MEPIEIFFAVVGLVAAFGPWLFPDFRHWVRRKWNELRHQPTGTEAPEREPQRVQPPEPVPHQPITPEPPPPEAEPLKVKQLDRQEYLNTYYETDSLEGKAPTYKEATEWFQTNGTPFQRQVADAVRDWVADCFAGLTDHYPGTQNDPRTKPRTLNLDSGELIASRPEEV